MSFIALRCGIFPCVELTAEDEKNEISNGGLARAILTSDDVDAVVEFLIVGDAAAAKNTETVKLEESGKGHQGDLLRPVVRRSLRESGSSGGAKMVVRNRIKRTSVPESVSASVV